jgi:hypothetical protein
MDLVQKAAIFEEGPFKNRVQNDPEYAMHFQVGVRKVKNRQDRT